MVVCLSPAMFKYRYGKGRALDVARFEVLPEELEGEGPGS